MSLLLIGLCVLAALGAVPLGIFAYVEVDTARARRFFVRAHRGETYFVWRTRGGWHDFVTNNIVPVLPADVVAVAHGHDKTNRRYDQRVWRFVAQARHPVVVHVGARALHIVSVRDELVPLRAHAKRDAGVSAHAGAIVAAAVMRARRSDTTGGSVGGATTSAAVRGG